MRPPSAYYRSAVFRREIPVPPVGEIFARLRDFTQTGRGWRCRSYKTGLISAPPLALPLLTPPPGWVGDRACRERPPEVTHDRAAHRALPGGLFSGHGPTDRRGGGPVPCLWRQAGAAPQQALARQRGERRLDVERRSSRRLPGGARRQAARMPVACAAGGGGGAAHDG